MFSGVWYTLEIIKYLNFLKSRNIYTVWEVSYFLKYILRYFFKLFSEKCVRKWVSLCLKQVKLFAIEVGKIKIIILGENNIIFHLFGRYLFLFKHKLPYFQYSFYKTPNDLLRIILLP